MIDLGYALACTHQEFHKASSSEIFNIVLFVEEIFSYLSSLFKSFTDQSSIQPIKKPNNDSLKTPFLPNSSTDQSSIQPIVKPKNDSLETPPNFSLDSTKIDCTVDQLIKDSKRCLYFIDGIRIDPENVDSTLQDLMKEDFENVQPKFLGSVTQGIMADGAEAALNHFCSEYILTHDYGDIPEFSINKKERTVTITKHFLLLSTKDNKPYRYKLQCETLVDFKTDEPSGKISYNFIAEQGKLFGQV